MTKTSAKGIYDCPVLSNREVARGIFLMHLHAPAIAHTVRPGQFVNILAHSNEVVQSTPFLRRPFSVCQVDRQTGAISILWKIVGPGTKLLATHRPETILNLIGPLGNGYRLAKKETRVALVAGGLGVAPLPILADALSGDGVGFTAMVGVRTKAELWGVEELQSAGGAVRIATDDGTLGHKGFVTELLTDWLQEKKSQRSFSQVQVYACGPMPMLKKIAQICEEMNAQAQVAIETVMGCGFGICMGCPVEPAIGVEEKGRYYLACIDGPVFESNDIRYTC